MSEEPGFMHQLRVRVIGNNGLDEYSLSVGLREVSWGDSSFMISDVLRYSSKNLLTVAVNNTLTRFTVPQGEYRWQSEAGGYPPGYSTLEYSFDFFNYAGIHRSDS